MDVNHDFESICYTFCFGENGEAVCRTLLNLEKYSQHNEIP
jgi:hypothetical protein